STKNRRHDTTGLLPGIYRLHASFVPQRETKRAPLLVALTALLEDGEFPRFPASADQLSADGNAGYTGRGRPQHARINCGTPKSRIESFARTSVLEMQILGMPCCPRTVAASVSPDSVSDAIMPRDAASRSV